MLDIDNLPVPLSSKQRQQIHSFYDALVSNNARINLTSRMSTDHLAFHFVDSIICADLIRSKKFLVDLGSGGGLPGIILSIVSPSSITLVESKQKKREFLHTMKDRLGLSNLTVFDGDVQTYAKTPISSKIDCFTAKAFAKPLQLIKYLRLFHAHTTKQTVCIVPISYRQFTVIQPIVPCETRRIASTDFMYMVLDWPNLKRYKADLEAQYNL